MPPRKKARLSQAASPAETSQPKTPTPVIEAQESPTKHAASSILDDPWTDEEEIGLFKGLMTWKPTGIHKRFRMLALHQYLLKNGYIHPRNEHTRPARIWRKLATLYDLEALDQREDARQLSDLSIEEKDEEEEEEDVYSEAENKIHRGDFSLPDEDFAELKWQQRFADERQRDAESPPALPDVNLAPAPPVRFTPTISVEPSEMHATARKRGQAKAGGSRGRGRATGSAATGGMRRSTRQAGSAAEDAEVESKAEESEEEEEESEDEDEESEASGPARTRATRGRGRGTARARGRGRGRGRGK